MTTNFSRNLHVPLSLKLYTQLKQQSLLSNTPSTQIARQAIETWLKYQKKQTLYKELVSYAAEQAGTDLDLDKTLEHAAIEWLRSMKNK